MKDVFFVGPFGYDAVPAWRVWRHLTIHAGRTCATPPSERQAGPRRCINQPNSAAMAQMAAKAPPAPKSENPVK